MSFSVEGRDVVVVGGGRSGLAAAKLLASRGARVTLTDDAPLNADAAEALAGYGVATRIGPDSHAIAAAADLVVLSPGVPPQQPVFDAARAGGVPVIGEIELASRWLSGRVIAITGTKGKSTTTTLTARMLEASGFSVTAGGNLGTPLSAQVDGSTRDALHVVEVSSFQLETIDTFHPWISVLVNLSPDHLDRHLSFDAYAEAKARIFMNQDSGDWAVVNADDSASRETASGARARRYDFSLDQPLADGVTVESGEVVARSGGRSRALFPVTAVQLPGRHLLADVLAATAVNVLAGGDADAMRRGVEQFGGLEHALERVLTLDDVTFVNDSKATNVVSVRRALESFDGHVVAIMGGRYKGGDFGELRDLVRERARGVVVIGEAAVRIAESLIDTVPVTGAASMEEAVRRAFEMAWPGDVVLLAPGCASFDMFVDYAARGRSFKDAARRLASERGQGSST